MNFMFVGREVKRTMDFRRVEDLPRRQYTANEELANQMTALLKAPNGTMTLRPIQAMALLEIAQNGGLLGAIGVGFGKTLVSLLAPRVLDAKRPLLLLPAQLKKITVDKVLPELSKHWDIPDIRIESFHAISLKKELLGEYQPDLIIADECHKISKKQAARTKRVLRYFKDNQDTKFVGLSGTITKRSIQDYWHLSIMALGEKTPLPLQWYEMKVWADAIDHGLEEIERPSVGAMRRFCTEDLTGMNKPRLREAVRKGYRDRLVSTPGVVATSEKAIGTTLIIEKRKFKPGTDIIMALNRLRNSWQTPGGEEISDAIDYWRKARELSTGFYYKWDWGGEPDREWLEARSRWRSFVRQLSSRSVKYDTEFLISNACHRGEIECPEFDIWTAIKDRAHPRTSPVWISETVIKDAINLATQKKNSIIWFEQGAVGNKIRELSNIPVFAGGSRANIQLVEHTEKGLGPCAASIHAHSTGVNLQAYSENIVLTPVPSGAAWEQLLGRTHRPGQLADEVLVTVYQHTKDLEEAMAKAIDNADYIEASTGQMQKLKYAVFV